MWESNTLNFRFNQLKSFVIFEIKMYFANQNNYLNWNITWERIRNEHIDQNEIYVNLWENERIDDNRYVKFFDRIITFVLKKLNENWRDILSITLHLFSTLIIFFHVISIYVVFIWFYHNVFFSTFYNVINLVFVFQIRDKFTSHNWIIYVLYQFYIARYLIISFIVANFELLFSLYIYKFSNKILNYKISTFCSIISFR